MVKEESFVVIENDKHKCDTNEYTIKERRDYIINNLRVKTWSNQLKTINTYLDNMMEQVTLVRNAKDNQPNKDYISSKDFPWPMFEIVLNDQNIQSLTKGFPSNFHVLYAEAEILKYLVS